MPELTPWNDPSLTLPVSFTPGTLERVRAVAVDGLLSLPRIGMGVGGYLIGRRDEKGIAITDFREIPCGHQFGPSFRLSSEEVQAAQTPSIPEGGQIAGLYISKPRGTGELADEDRESWDLFCREPWQVLMILLPSSVRPTRGAIYARNGKAATQGGAVLEIPRMFGEQVTLADRTGTMDGPEPSLVKKRAVTDFEPELYGDQPIESESAEFKSVGAPPIAAKAVEAHPLKSRPVEPARKRSTVVPPPPKPIGQPGPRPDLFAVPSAVPPALQVPSAALFAEAKPNRPSRLRWVYVAVLLVLLGIAYGTRSRWMPSRSLDLRASDSNGHLTIEWNRKAVRGLDRADLIVNDGPQSQTMTVDGPLLRSGSFDYARKTGHVSVRMRAGSADETTTFHLEP